MNSEQHAKIETEIKNCLGETADSIGRSFTSYWPADAKNKNDPAERNVSLHLAHILLKREYSMFAEADHPNTQFQGIDLLGISPQGDWFLACEIKRLFSAEKLSGMLEDLSRLETFWLKQDLTAKSCGEPVARLVKECRTGYGLVAGLHWVANSCP